MRSTNTFGVRLIIRCPKTRPHERAIYARVTVNRQCIEIALKRTIDPANWNGVKGRIEGNKDLAKQRRMTKAVMPDFESTDYLVTQAIADFLSRAPHLNLDGIIFPSSQDGGMGLNVVLFHKSSRVKPSTTTPGTHSVVSLEDFSEEGPFPWYTISEKLSAENDESVLEEVSTRENDTRRFSLELDEYSMEVIHVQSVNYGFEDHTIHFEKYDQPENRSSEQVFGT